MRKFVAAMGTLALAGCAGMSKEECLTADWRAIGYEDGARGSTVGAISGRRARCAKKAGVTADMNLYLAGREEGLSHFCTPASGFDLGARGGRYLGVCAFHDEHAFLSQFDRGHYLYMLRSDVTATSKAFQAAEQELAAVEDDIAQVELALVAPGAKLPERIELLAELKHLHEHRDHLKDDLPVLDRDRRDAALVLADYEDELAAEGRLARGVTAPMNASY